jgi:serine/threonine-protein kinase
MALATSPILLAGRYEILEKLGSGGLGDVFRARDTVLKRDVAIKLIRHNADINQRKEADQIWREAITMSEVHHSSIVTVYDFGMSDTGGYLVTELLRGVTLEHLLLERPLSQREAYDLARQSLEGLSAAHTAGVVHRDLNPGNFMVTGFQNDGLTVKIFDFGLAKFLHRPKPQTVDQQNSLLGSIHYMAPEQFDGEVIDHRADFYSLGCILYESLSQRVAFEGQTIAQVMYAHLDAKVISLAILRPDLTPEFTMWISGLMQRHAAARYSSAVEALVQMPPLEF